MVGLLRKLLDRSDREVKANMPIVRKINALEEDIKRLSDEDLANKTDYFKEELKNGKTLDDILPEAFAVVREVSWRVLGMRQFDVQLLGGIVLHKGEIAEMRTGEGKTLVAVAPIYLNALSGKGTHLVTVNDYLARRDATWMGPVYHFLKLSLGIIQGQSPESDELGGSYRYEPGTESEDPRYTNLVSCSRREAYSCDITYGTNHEFGFDYLRDNMAFNQQQLSMRELNFAIIDEVDSILIDEARTPHIISGPSNDDVSIYNVVDKATRKLQPEVHYTVEKKNHQASLTEEGMDFIEEQLQIDNIASHPKIFHHVNASVKAYALFDKDIDYVVRKNEVIIVDENTGRLMFGRRYSDGLHQALEAKEGVTVQKESQTVAVITFQNLFRLYNKLAGMTGTGKTEEDEFRKIYGLDVVTVPTHRPMIRKDEDDIIFKTIDGKFRGIVKEILKAYSKQQPVLVGTRSIEMTEKVSQRLTADMLQKMLLCDRLYDEKENGKKLDKDQKKGAHEVCNLELSQLNRNQLIPFLNAAEIPTDAFDKDNINWFIKHYELNEDGFGYIEEALKEGIPHNVLNAKYHEQEALIIAEAGRKGAITIATNMAGRGVDILLGGRIADSNISKSREEEEEEHKAMAEKYSGTFEHYRRGGKERAAPPLPLNEQERSTLADEVRKLGGLYIIGTERHESRRIDNQLRGRAGRLGDPGTSRFFVSLEDHLWKIFNPKMMENPLLKTWPNIEEVQAKFLSRMIKKTQERIENHFFESRKHTLEYDDVLNSQREHIYGMRREVLLRQFDIRGHLKQGLTDIIGEIGEDCCFADEAGKETLDIDTFYHHVNEYIPLVDFVSLDEMKQEFADASDIGNIVQYTIDVAQDIYQKHTEELGEDTIQDLEYRITLQMINDKWMDHLQIIEYIREGISLRGYGQVDPLVAYKRETYDLFHNTLRQIRDASVKLLFRTTTMRVEHAKMEQHKVGTAASLEDMQLIRAAKQAGVLKVESNLPAWPEETDPKTVARNDQCPCGSGKKFKACHYPEFRAQDKI